MCDYKILAHSSDGYILLCNSCGHYQLAFGTTAVRFEPGQFTRFCIEVSILSDTSKQDGFEKQKRIPLNINCTYSTMILSYSELIKLNELLHEAVFTDEMEVMLDQLKMTRG